MYISCIKTYANSLKYTFTVLGILALGIVIGLGTFGRMTGQAVTTMSQSMKADYEEADLSLYYITDAIVERVEDLTLWDVLNVIHDRSLKPLLIGTIEDSVEKVIANYTAFADQLYTEVRICAEAILVALIVGVLLILLSRLIGFFSVEIFVRRRMGSVGMVKLLLEMLVRFLMYAVAVFIILGLCSAFQNASTVFLCLLPVLMSFFGLIAAWMTTNPKDVSFGKVVSFANMGILLLANLSILAATALLGFAVYRLVNIVAAALVILSLLTVLLVSLDLSASAMAVKAAETAKTAPVSPEVTEEPCVAEIPAPAEEMNTAEETAPEEPAAEEPAAETEADPETLQEQLKKRLQGKLQE